MALAVAAGFSACSDDNDYEAGPQSPGAYFDKANPSSVNVNLTTTEFMVTVLRTDTSAPASYPLSIQVVGEESANLFSVPATATFAEGELKTLVPVSFDPTKVTQNKVYKLQLKLEDATAYGAAVYNVSFKRAVPLKTVPCPPKGQGTMFYRNLADDEVSGLSIDLTYNPEEPNTNRLYTIHNFGALAFANYDGIDLQVIMPDATAVDQYGFIDVSVPGVGINLLGGMSDGSKVEIYVADLRWFFANVLLSANAANYEPGWYDPVTGQFNLNLIYYTPENPGSYWGSYNQVETFQLDGFPEYGVSMVFDGFRITADEDAFVLFNLECAKDVETVKIGIMKDGSEQATLQYVLTDGAGVVEVDGAATLSVPVPITEGGLYTAVAVTYGEGEPQDYASVQFEWSMGTSNTLAGFEDAGIADFTDGWIIPGFTSNGVGLVAAEHSNTCELKKDPANPGTFVLVRPYGPDYFLTPINETAAAKRNIVFTLAGQGAIILPQESGFTYKGNKYVICNWEGVFRANEQNNDASDAEIVAYLQAKYPEDATWQEDGIITVGTPFFNSNGDGKWYNWKNIQQAVIVIDEDEVSLSQKVAKRNAAKLAAPKANSLRNTMAAEKRHPYEMQVPRSLSKNTVKPLSKQQLSRRVKK